LGSRAEKGGKKMQYAKMIDLIADAKQAGLNFTEGITEVLCEAFDYWLDGRGLGEITEEEQETLETAFRVGFAKTLPKKIIMSCVGREAVCEYTDCKREAEYEIADSEQDNENGIYTHRCEVHLNE
jgi:hypothetical protein